MRFCVFCLLALLFLHPAQAQSATGQSSLDIGNTVSLVPSRPAVPSISLGTAPVTRDAEALATIEKSIDAMGGVAAIAQVKSCVIAMTVDGSAASLPSGQMSLFVSGGDVRSEFQGPDGPLVFSTGGGKSFRMINGKAEQSSYHLARAWFSPVLVASELLQEAHNPNYSLIDKGQSKIGELSVIVVKTISNANWLDTFVTPQTWYFDSTTFLPIRVEHLLPDIHHPNHSSVSTSDVSQYQRVSGVLYPFQFSEGVGGKPIGVRTVTSIQPNQNVSPSMFAAPAGGVQ